MLWNTNAVDALPKGGTILISTVSEGQNILLSVKDDGVGMDSETKRRIFDPFFTTKQNVGSGLGLSMAYRTVSSWEERRWDRPSTPVRSASG